MKITAQDEFNTIVDLIGRHDLACTIIDTSAKDSMIAKGAATLAKTEKWLATLYNPKDGTIVICQAAGKATCLVFPRNDKIESQAVEVLRLAHTQEENIEVFRAAVKATKAPNTLVVFMAHGGPHWINTKVQISHLFA